MLYVGEGYVKMMLVDKGKINCTFSTGPDNEYDDVWMTASDPRLARFPPGAMLRNGSLNFMSAILNCPVFVLACASTLKVLQAGLINANAILERSGFTAFDP